MQNSDMYGDTPTVHIPITDTVSSQKRKRCDAEIDITDSKHIKRIRIVHVTESAQNELLSHRNQGWSRGGSAVHRTG